MAGHRHGDEHTDEQTTGKALRRRGLIAGAAALVASAAVLRQSQSVAATDTNGGVLYRAVTPFGNDFVLWGDASTLPDGNNVDGVVGFGKGAFTGIKGIGGNNSGLGVYGAGGGPNGIGIKGDGAGTGVGVAGISTGTGAGVSGVGGAGGGDGVLGQSSSGSTTKGVHGKHTANGYGVYGESGSGGYGVTGVSPDAIGVLGQSSGNGQSKAIYGHHTASGFGVYGESGSGGFGVTGVSPDAIGVNGTSTSGTGVQGTSSTGSSSKGVYGHHASNGYGVYGDAGPGGYGVTGVATDAFGVRGTSTSGTGVSGSSTSGAGVAGSSTGSSGVVGGSGSAAAGTAGGYFYTTADNGSGVVGQCFNPGGGAAAFVGAANAPNYAAYFTGDVVVTGNFVVGKINGVNTGGGKSAAVQHPLTHDTRLVYCVESPEAWFEDFGEGVLVNGKGEVKVDPDFMALIHADSYHVFLTPHDEEHHLAVKARGGQGFTVAADATLAKLKGKAAADLNGTFSWRLVGKRSDVQLERLAKFTMPTIKTADKPPLEVAPPAPVKKP